MREIIFKRAEKRELSENAWDSREMRETWQFWIPGFNDSDVMAEFAV